MDLVNIVSILIGLIALLIGFVSYVGQMNILVLNQLSEKAKECNNIIKNTKFQITVGHEVQVSNLLTIIITGIQLMDYHYNGKWYLRLITSRQECLDQFYLQFHTSIQNFIGKDSMKNATEIQSYYNNQTLNDLFRVASGNLNASYKKYP